MAAPAERDRVDIPVEPRLSLAGLLVALAAFGFYLATLAPGLVWADGGRLQADAVTGASLYWHFDELRDVRTDGWPFDRLGVAAWDHPAWVMLGHAIASVPFGDPAWWLNVLSALAAAATVGIVFVLVHRLTGQWWGAIAAAVALAVSHVFWFHAVTAQVHALNAFFMVLLIYQGLAPAPFTARRQAWFGLLAGLGLANHVMLGLPVLVSAGYLTVRHRRSGQLTVGSVAGAVAGFAIGLTPWWLQFIRMARLAGLSTTVTVAAGQPWLGERWPGPLGFALVTNLLSYLGILVYQFTPFGCVAGVCGAAWLWRHHRSPATYLLVLFGLQVLFSANYTVPDRFAFHLPSYLVFAMFVGCGVSAVVSRASGWVAGASQGPVVIGAAAVALMLLPIALYAVTPGILHRLGVTDADLGIPAVGANGRDGLAYFLNPNKHGEDSAQRYGREALAAVAPDALVLTAWPDDREPYVVMRYFQLTEGLRTDVTLDLMLFSGQSVPDSVLTIARTQHDCRPIYLASDNPAVYPIAELGHTFTIRREGWLYRLVPLRATMGHCVTRPPQSMSLTELLERARR